MVPLSEHETSFFGGLLNMIGIGEEEVEIIEDDEETIDPELEKQAESLPDAPESVGAEEAAPGEQTEME